MIIAHHIKPSIQVIVDRGSIHRPSDDVQARVESIWQSEISTRASPPFNGLLFSVTNYGSDQIVGWFAEYKQFLAQRRDPSLTTVLNIKPLAVTGLLACHDGIVIGRRSNNVEQDGGLWELVPSGGVDGSKLNCDGEPDVTAKILDELNEEIGIHASAIDHITPFALIEDTSSGVFDIGISMHTPLTNTDIDDIFRPFRHHDYSEISFVRDANRVALSPVSSALLKLSGK